MKFLSKYTFGIFLNIACFYALLLGAPSTHAQVVGISQNPSYIEVTAKPGSTVNTNFVIANVGDNQAFVTSIFNFDPKNPTKNIDGQLLGPIRFNLKNKDLSLDQPFFITEKKGKELILELRIPENTPSRDYYYTLTTTHETGRTPEGTTSITHQLFVNSVIVVTVTNDGTIEQNGSIGELRIDAASHIFQTKQPIPFKLIANNSGKNLIRTHGFLHIQGPWVNKRVPLVDENILALSGKQLVTKEGSFISGFFVGRYNIDAYVDIGGKIVTARTSFISVPTTIIGFLVLMIILFVVGRIIFLKTDSKVDRSS
jgi:hypothetical protein